VHFALPGTIGSLRGSFFPEGGLIEEQRLSAGQRGSGRIADLGPALRNEFVKKPVLGQGFGTRIVDKGRANAPILDNQWLGTLLETGFVGTLAWIWVFFRTVRRFGSRAKEDASPRGWLLVCVVASTIAFAVSMFTYDAFAFIQVTFLLYIMLAFGCVLVRAPEAALGRARTPRTGGANLVTRPLS
jgi:O-antigen ligase